jgi:hypothetical protein
MNVLSVNQAHISLIDERIRLQNVASTLPGHVPVRNATQFAVNGRDELFQSGRISGTPSM